MPDQNFDPFAPIAHSEITAARTVELPLGEIGGVLVRSAETIMTMPEADPRRPYAQEYVGLMLAGLAVREKRHEEVSVLTQSVQPGTAVAEPRVIPWVLTLPASTQMRHKYGGGDPF